MLLGSPTPGTAVYCGPTPLLAAVEDRCAVWPPVEHFSAVPTAQARPQGSFDVVLASTGQRLTVGADDSIADVLEAAGIDIPTSCREGICGTCETGVLKGVPDHRDLVLSAEDHEANDVIMVCCSRAKTPELVLDL